MNSPLRAVVGAVSAAALVALAGCGGGLPEGYVYPPEDETSTTVVEPVAEPAATGVNPQPSPAFQKANTALIDAGVAIDLYDAPALYVDETCTGLDNMADGTWDADVTASLFLRNQASFTPEQGKALALGMPILCPQHNDQLDSLTSGQADLQGGNYTVGTSTGDIAPGTWEATGPANDCYWERTSPSGSIIDNGMVTHATNLTVTVAASDGSVSFQRCPIMRHAG